MFTKMIVVALTIIRAKFKLSIDFLNINIKAAVYTCKAENWAGTSYKEIGLVVLSEL